MCDPFEDALLDVAARLGANAEGVRERHLRGVLKSLCVRDPAEGQAYESQALDEIVADDKQLLRVEGYSAQLAHKSGISVNAASEKGPTMIQSHLPVALSALRSPSRVNRAMYRSTRARLPKLVSWSTHQGRCV